MVKHSNNAIPAQSLDLTAIPSLLSHGSLLMDNLELDGQFWYIERHLTYPKSIQIYHVFSNSLDANTV